MLLHVHADFHPIFIVGTWSLRFFLWLQDLWLVDRFGTDAFAMLANIEATVGADLSHQPF